MDDEARKYCGQFHFGVCRGFVSGWATRASKPCSDAYSFVARLPANTGDLNFVRKPEFENQNSEPTNSWNEMLQPFAVALKQIPQKLVVHIVVILHFRSLYECPQQSRTAIR